MTITETELAPVEQPAELDEVGRVLMDMAEIVRERWAQFFDWWTPDGPRCPVAASREVTGGGDLHKRVLARLATSLGFRSDHVGAVGMIGLWNDAYDRTAEEVAEALEKAAIGL